MKAIPPGENERYEFKTNGLSVGDTIFIILS